MQFHTYAELYEYEYECVVFEIAYHPCDALSCMLQFYDQNY